MNASAPTMCAACGLSDPLDPCIGCGQPTGLSVSGKPSDASDIGRACVAGEGLDAAQGLVIGASPAEYVVLLQGGVTRTIPRSSVQLGEFVPGVDRALSQAGQVLLASLSSYYASLGGDPRAGESAAVDMVVDDLGAARLLAMEGLRQGLGEAFLHRLPVVDSERAWLLANHYADAGQWEQAFDQLARLPIEGYRDRIAVYLRGRRFLTGDPAHSRQAVAAADAASASPTAAVLATLLTSGDSVDLEELASIAITVDRRVAVLLLALQRGFPVREFVDVSGHVRSLDAVTSDEEWEIRAEELKGRSLTYIDELIDRGRLVPRHLPQYRAVLDDLAATYVTARLDPVQLSDEEVEESGLVAEAQRRAFLRGDVDVAGIADHKGGRAVVLVEEALQGSRSALDELRDVLDAPRLSRLEAALIALDDQVLPPEEVLTDQTLWESLERQLDPARLQRARPAGPSQRAFSAWVGLRAAKRALYGWQWESAKVWAKRSVELADDERVSDEALNLLAAAELQTGSSEAALTALEQALEGQYNSALQSNAVACAVSASPQRATDLLARLVAQAPDLETRVTAAHRGLGMWQESQSDQDLPKAFVKGLKKLIIERISLDDFTVFAEILVSEKPRWFRKASSLDGSPHKMSSRAKVLRGKAEGGSDWVSALARALRSGEGADDPWLIEQRDSLVGYFMNRLLTEDDVIGAASFAYDMIDEGLPMTGEDRDRLLLLAAREFSFVMDPNEEFLREDRILSAVHAWNSQRDDADFHEVADACMRVVAYKLTEFYRVTLVNNEVSEYEFNYGHPDEVSEKLWRLGHWGQHCLELLPQVQATVDDPELRDFMTTIINAYQQVLSELEGL